MKYCWLILVCSTVSIFLLFINHGSYGRIVIDVHNSFPRANMATLMTTGSTFLFVNSLLTLAALSLIRLYTPFYTNMIITCVYTCGMLLASCSLNEYQFMVSYGAIAGLGSIFNRVGYFLVGNYFPPDHRFHIFATSWTQCIYPLAMSCTVVYNFVIRLYGWRLYYVIYSTTVFVTGIMTSLMYARYEGESDHLHKTQADTPTVHNSWSTKLCILLFTACNFCLATFINMPMYILPKFAHDEGISIENSTRVTAYFGTADLVCRLIFTLVGDRLLKGRLLYLYLVFSLAIAAGTGIFGLAAHTYDDFVAYSIIVGALSGPLMTGQYAVCYEVSHGLYANEIYAVGTVARGIAYLFSLYICGWIYDSTNSFRNSLIFFICMQVAAALFPAIILLIKHVPHFK